MTPSRSEVVYRVTASPRVLRRLEPTFLSVTIDTSVLIGGRWWGPSRGTSEGLSRDRVAPLDLDHPDLARWAGYLTPALVRVGGTEADRIAYGFQHDAAPGQAHAPDTGFVLRGRLWERFNTWAQNRGFQVLFTVSADPRTRGPDGRWDPAGAERLIRNTRRKGYPVVAWEFGNEVNAYPFLYGPGRAVGRRQYLEDFGVFANLVRRLDPGALTVGPSSAVWPLIGEPNPLIPALGRSPVSAFLDVLSFHYYPQQSSRGRVAVRRARETTLLNARNLDGVLRWVRHARRALDRGPAAGAPLWLTEVGHALYGGQPGVSDTWLSTPWWLDQLGLLAHAGVGAVFRQSLVGGDYGLLDPQTFAPRPDYFASLLWNHHMGPLVHDRPAVQGPDKRVRAWHHGREQGPGCLLLVNLHRRRTARIEVPGASGYRLLGPAGALDSRQAVLDGLVLEGEPGVRHLRGGPWRPLGGDCVRLPPLHCAFVAIPE